MDRAYEIAEKYNLEVVEDCAHALGIQWRGEQLGKRARVACFSTQSAKMINSGEGGFLCTDDPEIAARAYCYAGCYEKLYLQHGPASPPAKYFESVKRETPNYSLRMSDLAAACVVPQVATMEERISVYNQRYTRIADQLSACPQIDVPALSPRVRPVCDS